MTSDPADKVLVVGASGFVGKSVVRDLLRRGKNVIAASRTRPQLPTGVQWYPLPDLTSSNLTWDDLPAGVGQIVYLAARVHIMQDTHPVPLSAYRAVNRDAALSLAYRAQQQGVQRFIYLSSIKVNGEASERPITELDHPAPADPYGISKLEAECALLDLGKHTDLDVVIIRPPLVYGPGVKANFMALAKAAGQGIPLPIGAIRNRRSMVYVENLADLIATVLEHPQAAGEVFLAGDGQDLSTPQLTRMLAESQGRRAWLPALPVVLLEKIGQMSGRSNVIHRLTGSLQVDIQKAYTLLDWSPPYPVWQALARTGQSLLQTNEAEGLKSSKPYIRNFRQRMYLRMRGLADRMAAAAALFMLSPLYMAIAWLIQRDSPGPALFVQERAGRHHLPFSIYKFRTMRTDTPHLSTEEMQRSGLNPVTRIGAILRRTSLDELPQLLNVLKGEMSLVGPRPALMTQTRVLTLRERAGVDQLLPGITGYAQATGRDDLSDEEKVRRDRFYLENLGPSMDLRVIWLTVRSVFKGTGNK